MNGDVLQSMAARNKPSGYEDVHYLFQLTQFEEWFELGVMLCKIYRSLGDDGYTDFLHELSKGGHTCLSGESKEKLLAWVGKPVPADLGFVPVFAWSNREVDAGNKKYIHSQLGELLHWSSLVCVDDGAEGSCGVENIAAATTKLLDIFPDYLHSDGM